MQFVIRGIGAVGRAMSVSTFLVALVASPSAFALQRTGPVVPPLVVLVGNKDLVFDGDRAKFRLDLFNASAEPVSNVAVTAETPEGTVFASATAEAGTCATPAAGQSGTIRCDVGAIAATDAITLEFEFEPTVFASGTEIRFRPAVTSSALDVDVEQVAFLVDEGDPYLRWDRPFPAPGAPAAAAPRFLTIERAKEPLFEPTNPTLAPFFEGDVYKIYRSDSADEATAPETLVATIPATQFRYASIERFAGPGFYVVAREFVGQESAASNAVSLGAGEPVVSSVDLRPKKLTATGTAFEDPVAVTLDGIPFAKPARVDAAGTSATQKGKLANGQTIKQYVREHGTILVCIENASGGISCVRYGGVITVP